MSCAQIVQCLQDLTPKFSWSTKIILYYTVDISGTSLTNNSKAGMLHLAPRTYILLPLYYVRLQGTHRLKNLQHNKIPFRNFIQLSNRFFTCYYVTLDPRSMPGRVGVQNLSKVPLFCTPQTGTREICPHEMKLFSD